MAFGLSVMELYGTKTLIPDFTISSIPFASLFPFINGMSSTPGLKDEENKETRTQYPVFGLPLHRSPAVLAALCDSEKEKLHLIISGNQESRNESQQQQTISEKTEFCTRHQQNSYCDRTHLLRRKIVSEKLHNRSSSPFRPYPKVKTTLEKSQAPKLHQFPSYPDNLNKSDLSKPATGFSKSFSEPTKLNLKSGFLPETKSFRQHGNRMNAFAIANLSESCIKTQTKIISLDTPSTSFTGIPIVINSKDQQSDNFRKLNILNMDMLHDEIREQRRIANSLANHGLCVIDGFLGNTLGNKIRESVLRLHAQSKCMGGELIGTNVDKTSIRGDVVTWVDGTEPHCKDLGLLCQKMDKIVSFGAGVAPAYQVCGGTKLMVARYPGQGTRYRKHVDNPAKDGRCLTCIYYLNENWNTATMGGTLRIHSKTNGKTANVAPLFDRLVVFYSDGRNPHEVLPCYKDRFAVTLWYFDLNERAKALERMDSMAQAATKPAK